MSGLTWLAIRLYSWLIRLYPGSFREEFGAEMAAVFAQTMADVAQGRKRDLLALFWREFRDYPFSLLRQHWINLSHLEPKVMTTIKKPVWYFYPTWIILTALCVPIAFILSLIVLKVITSFVGDFIYVDGVRHITEDYLAVYVFVPVAGLLTGVIQYGLLRRYLPRMGWWVLATAGGWLLGMLLIIGPTILLRGEPLNLSLSVAILGLSIGVGQWLLLRRRLPRAAWWIVANVLGWGLFGLVMGDSFGQFGLIVLGLLPTCVTAGVLALLMNQAQASEI